MQRRRVVAGQQRQQPVVQHLQLARQAVADVDLQAAVVLGQRHRAGRQRHQVQEAVLQPGQQVVGVGGLELGIVDHAGLAAGIDEQPELRLRLPPPGRQQRVADLVVLGPAARRQPGQPARVDDLEPELGAGVQRVDVDLAGARDLRQQRQVQRRHGRQREQQHLRRQAGGRGAGGQLGRGQPRECRRGVCQRGRRLGGGRLSPLSRLSRCWRIGHQPARQRRLPGLVGMRRVQHALPVAPGRPPVGAVGGVLAEQRGHRFGQLQPHHRVGTAQVGVQARVGADEAVVAERGVHAPGQCVAVQRAAFGQAGQQALRLAPQPRREPVEGDLGADALGTRHGQREQPLHRGAGDDHLVGAERVVAHAAELRDGLRQQDLAAVREVQVQHPGRCQPAAEVSAARVLAKAVSAAAPSAGSGSAGAP